ncbi:MAG: hypothetical protein R3C03_22790 [Pirellulaceae bacterium]
MFFRSKRPTRFARRSSSRQLGYEALEDRRVLATTFSFDAGNLSVLLTEPGDSAVFDTPGDNSVTINGEEVLDSNNVRLTAGDVNNITVTGNSQSGQNVQLGGYFDYNVLNDLTIEHVSSIQFTGEYTIGGDLRVNCESAEAPLTDIVGCVLTVAGKTDIYYPDFAVVLRSTYSKYFGDFSTTAYSLFINTDYGLNFGDVNVDHTLFLDVAGNVTQTSSSAVHVGLVANLTSSENISLLNQSNDFNRVSISAMHGSAALGDANSLTLGQIDVFGNLTIVAQGTVGSAFDRDYRIEGDLSDSMFNGSDLIAIGGQIQNGRFSFLETEGLKFSPNNSEDYYFEFEFTRGVLSDTFKKLVDFKGLANDAGLYLTNDVLHFFPMAQMGRTLIREGESHVIGVLRSNNIVSIFLDGEIELSFTDTDRLAAVAGSFIHLFVDDNITSGNEGTVGSTDFVRMADTDFRVGGNLDITTSGNISLVGRHRLVRGFISLSGNDVSFSGGETGMPDNRGSLKFRNIHAQGDLVVNATGDLLQAGGSVTVLGSTHLYSVGNIRLHSASNNFGGSVSAEGESIRLGDKNHLLLDKIFTAGYLEINAVGVASTAPRANMEASGLSRFAAGQLYLGTAADSQVTLSAIDIETTGRAVVNQASTIRIANVVADSLFLWSTDGDIRDNANASIQVANNAKFIAVNSIVLGDTTTDSVQVGSLTFQSDNDLIISVNGDLEFTGNSFTRSIYVDGLGNITDSSASWMQVNGRATFMAGGNIFIGDHPDDRFNAALLSFNAGMAARIEENSDMVLTGDSAVGFNAVLKAQGRILDTASNILTVGRKLYLDASNVVLGDGLAAVLRFQSLQFQNVNNLTLIAESAITFLGNSDAQNVDLYSYHANGIGNEADTNVNIVGSLKMEAALIDLGRQANDSIRFGRLTFRSSGLVTIEAESEIILTQNNTAGSLRLFSPIALKDVATSTLDVAATARLAAPLIVLGDQETDRFNAGSLSFYSTGLVSIGENSSSNLAGQNRAAVLRLTSSGHITDVATADTIIADRAVFMGVNIILGERDDDCFDVLAGIDELITMGTGIIDVRLGC